MDEIAIPVVDGDIDATKHACTRDLVDPEKVNTHDRRGHTPLALSLMEQRHDLFDTLIGWLWGDIYSAMCEHGSPGTLRRYIRRTSASARTDIPTPPHHLRSTSHHLQDT